MKLRSRCVPLLLCLFVGACDEPTTLRVALYPYVPDARALFYELEAEFEKLHPGVNVELVETGADYYDGGLLAADADVYEIDSVLLEAMVREGKVSSIVVAEDRFVPGALEATTIEGSVWAVPHWVCGNFLFHAVGDTEVEGAATWDELVDVLDDDRSLLIDLKGTSTLGEWYVTALGSSGTSAAGLREYLDAPDLDEQAVNLLTHILEACPDGSCRNLGYHERSGYYARRFARSQSRAYVGYSETLFYTLNEIVGDCETPDACLSPESIAVRALPYQSENGAAMGWVDGLAVAADLPDDKAYLAREFIDFLTSWDGYELILKPEWGESARYLMPAVQFSNDVLREFAPLYPAIFEAYKDRTFLTGPAINTRIREMGSRLECALPGSGDDCR